MARPTLASYAQIVDPGFSALSGYINQSTFNFEYYPWDAEQQKWSEIEPREHAESNITHPDFVVARNHEILIRPSVIAQTRGRSQLRLPKLHQHVGRR